MSKLFTDFPPVSTDDWEKAIHATLKGKNYEDTLLWNTEEGFDIKPYYRKEDLPSTSFSTFHKSKNEWNIREAIVVNKDSDANKIALDALMKGATAISFQINTGQKCDIPSLLKGIKLQYAPVYIYLEENNTEILESYIKFKASQEGIIKGGVYIDPIGNLATGRLSQLPLDQLNQLNSFISKGGKLLLGAYHFSDCGSNITQELAFALAGFVDVLEHTKIDFNTLIASTEFKFSIGPNYFFEIVKLKSFSFLLSKIAEAYHTELNANPEYSAISTINNKTIFDPHVNMLRGTTEAMSACIAGYDNITILPFDITYQEANEFSARIARNIQLILKEESYLDKVLDPASGSYYLENLTETLINNTWTLFEELEEANGFIQAFEDGFVQAQVQSFFQNKQALTESGDHVLLGTNKYPNLNEMMSEEVIRTGIYPEPYSNEVTQQYAPLSKIRLSELLEEKRLKEESSIA